MYERASNFINSDRFAAFVGTDLELKTEPGKTPSRPGKTPRSPKEKLTGQIILAERCRLG